MLLILVARCEVAKERWEKTLWLLLLLVGVLIILSADQTLIRRRLHLLTLPELILLLLLLNHLAIRRSELPTKVLVLICLVRAYVAVPSHIILKVRECLQSYLILVVVVKALSGFCFQGTHQSKRTLKTVLPSHWLVLHSKDLLALSAVQRTHLIVKASRLLMSARHSALLQGLFSGVVQVEVL